MCVFVVIVECGGFLVVELCLNIGCLMISVYLLDLEVRFGIKLCKCGCSGFEIIDVGVIIY